jgi:hypothetical protein
MEIELDLPRLQQDIAAGNLPGVEVLTPEQIKASILDDIRQINPAVDAEAAIAGGPAGIDEYLNSLNLSRSQSARLGRRLLAYYNTSRDGEYLIKGVIPSQYLKGPTPTGGGSPP